VATTFSLPSRSFTGPPQENRANRDDGHGHQGAGPDLALDTASALPVAASGAPAADNESSAPSERL